MITPPETRAQYQNAVDAIDSDSGGLPTWLAVDTPDLSTMLTDLDRLARIEGMAEALSEPAKQTDAKRCGCSKCRSERDKVATAMLADLLRPSAPDGPREET